MDLNKIKNDWQNMDKKRKLLLALCGLMIALCVGLTVGNLIEGDKEPPKPPPQEEKKKEPPPAAKEQDLPEEEVEEDYVEDGQEEYYEEGEEVGEEAPEDEEWVEESEEWSEETQEEMPEEPAEEEVSAVYDNPRDLSLGGISIGQTSETVKAMYGQPDKIAYAGGVFYYYYGDSLALRFMRGSLYAKGQPKVVSVMATSSAATPAGLAIGMSEKMISALYGESDSATAPSEETGGQTVYSYYNGSQCLNIYVAGGVISALECAYRL